MGDLESILANMDQEAIIKFALILNAIFSVIGLFTFVLKARWLYLINKKKWEPHPWLAWIPVIQIYAFVRAAWKPWIWILWLILWFIALIIPWVIIYAILCYGIAKRTNRGFWSAVWIFFLSFIMLPIIGIKLEEKKKKSEKLEEKEEKYDY